MPTINVGNLENQEKIIELLHLIQSSVYNLETFNWEYYFGIRRTGELFSTKFYEVLISDSGIGEFMNDSAGKQIPTPSTEIEEGQDDFANHNAFWYVLCNFIVDDNGKKIPTALEGQGNFKKRGKVNVGVLTPPLYWGRETVSDGYIHHFSDSEIPSKRPDLVLTLMPHCRDNKGNPMPYGIVPVYYAGEIDGIMYGSSGLAVKNFISYQSLHTEMKKLGAGYVGAGAERSAYLKNFLWIKYATLNSQKYFKGCTSYNFQYAAAIEETGVNYIILNRNQANRLYVGSTVSIGEVGENTNFDRSQAYTRNIADKVLITKIESIDDTYSKVYVDTEPFDTTLTTYISTMPLHSGQTDNILGNDGYIVNDSKHSFKIQGVEEGIGTYFLSSNELMHKESATDTVFYVRGGAEYSIDLSLIQNTWKKIGTYLNPSSSDFWIGETIIDLETGMEVPQSSAGGDSKMTGDRFYFGGTIMGLREYLSRGALASVSSAGLSFVVGGYGVSNVFWYSAACVS